MLVGLAAKLALAALSRTAVIAIWIDFIVFSSIVALEPAGPVESFEGPWIICEGLYDWVLGLDELQNCNPGGLKVTQWKQQEVFYLNLLIINDNYLNFFKETKH